MNIKKLHFLVVALFLLLLSCKKEEKATNIPKNVKEATVVRVIDGDTIVVNIDGMEEKVRLIGVDTPESRVNKRATVQERELNKDVETIVDLGKQAKEFTKSLVKPGMKVYLEFDVQPRDKYGRLLAYLYLPDGRMLNKEIICNGYAMPLTVPPNVKYEKEFRECFQKAREEKKGLWNE
ncbi:MAG: thermonuclease family protein [Hydrogenothermaceae bacterium]|nr:thermonuclease family protein [Hydrogenothermaceae bacterium]